MIILQSLVYIFSFFSPFTFRFSLSSLNLAPFVLFFLGPTMGLYILSRGEMGHWVPWNIYIYIYIGAELEIFIWGLTDYIFKNA